MANGQNELTREVPQTATPQSDATGHLQQEALRLYQCGSGGAFVSRPGDCRTMAALPTVTFTDGNQEYASRTYRNSDEGSTTDGGKVLT